MTINADTKTKNTFRGREIKLVYKSQKTISVYDLNLIIACVLFFCFPPNSLVYW